MLLSIVVLLLGFSHFTVGEIYKWKDASGKPHFSDKPPEKDNIEIATMDYKDKKVPDIYFPFNNSIKDHGPYKLAIENHLKNVTFSEGSLGKSLFIGSEGGWIDVILDKKIDFSRGFKIELIFKPVKNKNDNKNPIQTLVSLNKTQGSIGYHWYGRRVFVGVWSIQLWSEKGTVKEDRWNKVKLSYNTHTGTTLMYLNGVLVGKESTPIATRPPNNILRIGTWYKDNQAYTGYIDELKVYALSE